VTGPNEPSPAVLEDSPGTHDDTDYQLTLFVNGASELSARAVGNASQLCESHLAGRYHLSVIDVHDDPSAVISNRVFATPTLVKHGPPPMRRLVGDLSDTDKVLLALDLPFADDASASAD
jgi:circadian clock protein KaiB